MIRGNARDAAFDAQRPTGRAQLGKAAAAWILVLAGGTLAGCPSPEPPRSVVVVVVDTLRADHLGVYGATRPTSPFLDGLAPEGRVFERAYATSPWTLPSVASLLTGLVPSRHGAGLRAPGVAKKRVARSSLYPEVRSLAGHLGDRGFATFAVVQNPYLGPEFGLDRGFAVYDHATGRPDARRADRAVRRALELVDGARGQRFFLLLHLFDPHLDYDAPAALRGRFTGGIATRLSRPIAGPGRLRKAARRMSPEDWRFIEGAYDEEIRFVDDQLRELVNGLRERGLWEELLFVFTSDHGEEFFDHGGFEHGHTVYDELVRVPLVAWGRGVTPGRDMTPVSLADLTPTVLDALGEPIPPGLWGVSLWRLLLGTGEEPAPGRVLTVEATLYGPEAKAAIDWPYKLLHQPGSDRSQLFDLERDPGERHDLAARWPKRVRHLRAELDRLGEVERPPAALGPEVVEELRALGYLQ